MKRKPQQGVALVVTLLLLSVITFLTVAFLALSRRERGSVTTSTDQTLAQLAGRAAYERAVAEVVSDMLAHTNRFAYGLRVSTNRDVVNMANVNGFLSSVTNLVYDPQVPVFIRTNANSLLPLDFRFYLDLNRDGQFEPTGWLPVAGPTGTVTNNLVGDPQWVGGLTRPDLPHSAANRFLYRWAYLIVPSGMALDLNYVFNQAKLGKTSFIKDEGFLRNQGVGTWELNLPALLRDLNTNLWTGYNYNPTMISSGPSFADAVSLLRYRYSLTGSYADGDFHNLATLGQYLGSALAMMSGDPIDRYPTGPLMGSAPVLPNNDPTAPWPGADNVNHFFSTQDLFDPAKVSPAFVNRLLLTANATNAYDRYTFYRLLSALGTDSGPESADLIYADQLRLASPSNAVAATPKVHLNFINVAGFGGTNAVPWENAKIPPTSESLANMAGAPLRTLQQLYGGSGVPGAQFFFANTADRLLRDPSLAPPAGLLTGLSVTNILLWPATNSLYSAAVHRLLQLSANIYDATTADPFPSLFRPVFTVATVGGVKTVRISGYVNDNRVTFYTDAKRWTDLPSLASSPDGDYPDVLVYGVPVVVGAKKGFPNFNEVALQNIVLATRKLELRKQTVNGPVLATNQMFILSLTNVIGLEAWNSYAATYPGRLSMMVSMEVRTTMRNEIGPVFSTAYPIPADGGFYTTNIPANGWPGNSSGNLSFKAPIAGGYLALSNCIYWQNAGGGGTLRPMTAGFQPQLGTGFPVPRLWLDTTNRVRFVLVDRDANRVVDFVSLDGLANTVDIAAELGANTTSSGIGAVWRTNRVGGGVNAPTEGIRWQMEVSLGHTDANADWKSYSTDAPTGMDKQKAIDAFNYFMDPRLYRPNFPDSVLALTNLSMQTPFNPARRFFVRTSWQANDPLVHYTAADLMDLQRANEVGYLVPPGTIRPTDLIPNIGRVNTRYRPWPVDATAATADPDAFNLALKDPLVRNSDDWNFPTNRFANVGWLGRVHRGTPWQTVYLKSAPVAALNWQRWTGNPNVNDAAVMRPSSDWALLDHFTTAPNDNATRGQLSVNQSELAAWSAVLSGVYVLTNTTPDATVTRQMANVAYRPQVGAVIVEPAGVAGVLSPVGRIWDGINRERYRTVTNNVGGQLVASYVHPDGTFWRLGDILSVPELTVASPFLNFSAAQQKGGLDDAAYERIPQQILSLLRGDDTPRFVIYAYGQALRPAAGSIVTGGPFVGTCTNYQVMAESATRTVVRIDNSPPPLPLIQAVNAVNPAAALDMVRTNRPRAVVESFNILPPD